MTTTTTSSSSTMGHCLSRSPQPKGPRPLTTPRRPPQSLYSAPPDFTPSSASIPLPQLRVIAASPGTPLSPKLYFQPNRLGEHWTPSPLRFAVKVEPPAVASLSAASCRRAFEFDPHGPHAALLENLVSIAKADERQLATMPREACYEVIDDVLAAVYYEDGRAANAIVFGEDDDEVDLEFRTIEQLQDVCRALAEELVIVDGHLRLLTDDSTF